MEKLSTLLILMISSQLFSQTADGGIINAGADINIASGTYIYIDGASKGDYVVSGDGELFGAGEMHLEGDWINNNPSSDATSGSYTGKIELLGLQNNMIIGGSSSSKFYNLEINRSGQNVNVNSTTRVSNVLTLTLGYFTTSANKIEVTSNAAGAVSGGSSSSFVNGNLGRDITISTTYAYPIGDGITASNYHKADVITDATFAGVTNITGFVKEKAKGASNTDAQFVTASQTQNGTDLIEIAENSSGDYIEWDLTPTSGSLSSGSFGVNLYLNDYSGLTDDQFTIVKRSSGSSDFADFQSFQASTTIPANGAVGRTVAGGYAQKSGFTSFSGFTIANGEHPLPVELIHFGSACDKSNNQIEFSTTSESNNDYFVLEQSQDAEQFEEFEIIYPESTNSNTQQDYSVAIPNQGAYYRLKQVDLDGVENYHHIIYASTCKTDNIGSIDAYTLNNSSIMININALSSGIYKLSLKDVNGKTLMQESVKNIEPGFNQFEISTNKIATGFYMISVQSEQEIYGKKIFLN